jgi:hypothetical protein
MVFQMVFQNVTLSVPFCAIVEMRGVYLYGCQSSDMRKSACSHSYHSYHFSHITAFFANDITINDEFLPYPALTALTPNPP